MRRKILSVVLVVAVISVLLTPGPAVPAEVSETGAVPSGIVDRYVSRRPTVGPVTVAQVGAASSGQKLLATTLQGVVNRDVARLYLVGMRPAPDDQFWLDEYVDRGLITVTANGSLDAALDTFAGEASGYVIASFAEPWTINTATTVAGVEGGVVATPELVAGLQARGLTEIADHRGQWPDAVTAYESTAAAYADQLDLPAMAIQSPSGHNPRDFFVQQGLMTVFTRPSSSDFDEVYALLDPLPVEHPVYGYVSDTGIEEVVAVGRLATAGRYLVPTDTTSNLSFHVAVGAEDPRVVLSAPEHEVAPCTTDDVNVVLAFTDGDNMVIPESRYPTNDRWNSSNRGELAMGWSLGASTAVLAPSMWDYFASGATANDEIVDLMGLGYTFTSVMPNAVDFLSASFELDELLGVRTHWSLDATLSNADAPGWSSVAEAATISGYRPEGMLLNYLNFGGPAWFHEPGGITVLNSKQGAYEDGAPELANQINEIVALDPSERPLVTFFAVTVWEASYDSVLSAVGPLTADGVRFLTPSEAVDCLPDPPVPPTPPPTTPPAPAPSPDGLPPLAPTTGGVSQISPISISESEPRFTG